MSPKSMSRVISTAPHLSSFIKNLRILCAAKPNLLDRRHIPSLTAEEFHCQVKGALIRKKSNHLLSYMDLLVFH